MNYTLHQLQVFLKVVRKKSITKAAEEMHMTQPALSIQLKNFQQQFDFPLTEVIGRRLHVTEFGESIAELAENVLREVDAIRYKSKEYEGLYTGTLRISSASTGKYVIPYFLSDFLEAHTDIDLVLDVTNKTQVISSLRNNEIDFALVSVVPEKIDVEEELLLDNRLYMVGREPQFDKRKPLIYREAGSATRAAMEEYFSGRQQRKRIELTSNEAVKQAVLAGLGTSILPLIGIRSELQSGELHTIPAKGLPMTTSWRLIWLRKKKLSPVADAFLQYLRREKQNVIARHFKWYLDYQ